MAGDTEQPLRLSFLADSLHSGSISFGRFEAESLSWERRSSFSHNRYLEEVEKYSKPGTVTEKKAYFEAHFRKKPLLSQSSLESQNERESEKNDKHNHRSFDAHEYTIELGNFTCFDQSPDGSECEREDNRVNESEPHVETTNDAISNSEQVKPEAVFHTENAKLVLSGVEPEKDTHFSLVQVGDETSNASDPSLQMYEKDNRGSSRPRTSPIKLRAAFESKITKAKSKSLALATLKITKERSEARSQPRRMASEELLGTKLEKKFPRPATPIIHSEGQTSKSAIKDMGSSKPNIACQKKSFEKLLGTEDIGSLCSKSVKSPPLLHQAVSRPKQTAVPVKPGMKSGPNFKGDQLAERRKKEKPEAKMKQFQKSLSFKAKAIPSFYGDSVSASDKSKVGSTDKTLRKSHLGLASGNALPQRTTRTGAKNEFELADASGLRKSYVKATPKSPILGTKINHVTDNRRQEKKDIILVKKLAWDAAKDLRVAGRHKTEF